MARTKTTDKASVKNGRASRATGAAYNANHNTLEATRINQSHIDQTRMYLNSYIKFEVDGTRTKIRGGQGGFDAKAHELQLYEHYYGDGLEARNQRYISEGHRDRCQTMEELYSNPKTAPLETIFQVGSRQSVMDKRIRTNALARAWSATMAELQNKFGENIVAADCSLHRDEAEDHLHNRMLLMARDKYGHLVPNQTAALKQMGFDRPDPEKPLGRYNNPLISFTDYLRETFYRECERQGVQIDREVENHSKRQVEILEYKCEKFREEMQATEERAKNARLEAQAASQALSKTKLDIETLSERIVELERSKAALEERTKALVVENQTLKTENNKLRSENIKLNTHNEDLEKQAANFALQLEKLRKEKAIAEEEKVKAEQARASAVAKQQKIEAYEKELYRRYKGSSASVLEELPQEPEKKSWNGKVKAAQPRRYVVEADKFDQQKKLFEYNVRADYNTNTIEKINSRMSKDETVQELNEKIAKQQLEINRLKQTADNLYMELEQRKGFLYRHGLEPAYNKEQQQIHSQSQSHTPHRR